MIKYKFFWLSLIILFVAVFVPMNGKMSGPSFDKLAHLLLFAFVTLNTVFYFAYDPKKNGKIVWIILALPILTEVIQNYIPGRSYDHLDVIADFAGILVGVILFRVFKKQFIALYKLFGDTYTPNPNQDKWI